MDIREKLKLLLGLKQVPEEDELAGFSSEQLEEAKLKAREVFLAAREEKDASTAEEALEIARAVKAELASRVEAEEEMESKFTEMAAEFEDESGEGEDADGEADGESDEAAEVTADADGEEEEVTETPEEVTETPAPEDNDALRSKLLAAAAKPVVPKPSKLPAPTSPTRIVASADLGDLSPGMTMDISDLSNAYVEKAKAVRGGRPGSRSSVAKVYLDNIPDDQTFIDRGTPADENMARINALVASAQEETAQRLRQIVAAGPDDEQILELTAAGGFCRPFPSRYDICTQGDDVRPLRDSLISLRLGRGGLQYIKPPRLSDVEGSVNVYTEEQDAHGYDYPKGCIRVECPDHDTAIVQAVTLCMEVGNFQKLAWPEVFRTWWRYGQIHHARVAETELWDGMVALSTPRTANTGFGAFRNTLTELERYSKQLRYEYRIAPAAPLRLWIPDWAVAQLRADLINQAPGDNTLGVSDAQLYRYLASLNIAVSPIMDGQDPGTGDDPLPNTVTSILALEGTFIRGELGELNFGTEIRDWDQIRNNDSGAFMEIFETVFAVCNGPQAIELPLCPTGTSSAPVTDTVVCES